MNISDELGRLGELHQRGVLTDEEFAQAKSRLLGKHNGAADSASASPFVANINALRRSRDDRWLAGVCGGIARATAMESWVCVPQVVGENHDDVGGSERVGLSLGRAAGGCDQGAESGEEREV